LFTLTLVVRLADKTIHMLFTKIGYHVLFIGSKFNSAANSGVSAAMARISKFTGVADAAQV
jgi:ribose/xylose/arabinose/galactoside ABC-type transport system permease subunit